MIVFSHGVFAMNPQLSAVIVIALAFRVDQIVFESIAESTVLRMITLLLPPQSLASLIAHAHRFALQDRLYKGLHADRLY